MSKKRFVKCLDPLGMVKSMHADFEKDFDGNLHNLLWQIIVNDTLASRDCCLTVVIRSEGVMLGLADRNEPGYQPLHVWFKNHNYDSAMDICTRMNNRLFELDEKAGYDIVASSMAAQNRQKEEQEVAHVEEG